MSTTPGLSWWLVVPVKMLAHAKSRIAPIAGPHREALALAVAADTVAAALRCHRVDGVVVVTDDPVAAADLSALGARVAPDEPRAGLNPALRHGARHIRADHPGCGVGALSADLPALREGELARALEAAASAPMAFVADAHRRGTTLFTARPGAEFAPAFGEDSRARHRARGARELALEGIDGLRRDVDTLDDLRAALTLGVGPRTAAVAAHLPVAT